MAAHAKVLIVEDSKLLCLANEHVLAKAGFEVSTAGDGEEALRVANDKLPDVILLDMLLPKISGLDVLRALKESPATVHIPVIVVSVLPQRNEEKLLREGAAAYLEKGSLDLDKHSERLVSTVQSVLADVNSRDWNQLLK